jgi:hypothetical protein
MTQLLFILKARLLLVKKNKRVLVCNYTDNYYGDQHCCEVETT